MADSGKTDYSYIANANLVLKSNRRDRENEPTGEAVSLVGHLSGARMGDRVGRSRPDELIGKKEQSKKRRDREEHDNTLISKRKKAEKSILTTSDIASSLTYTPKTRETRIIWEQLLGFLQNILGDQPYEVLAGAVEEVVAIIRNEELNQNQKRKEIHSLLGAISDDSFASLNSMGKDLVDFQVGSSNETENPVGVENMEDVGVAVIFDNEEDERDEDEYNDVVVDEEDNGGEDDDEVHTEEDSEVKEDLTATVSTSKLLKGESSEVDYDSLDIAAGLVPIREIDGYYLQRQVSRYVDDASLSQELSEGILEVLNEALESSEIIDTREIENKLLELLDLDMIDLIKLIVKNSTRIAHITKFRRLSTDEEREKYLEHLSADVGHDGPSLVERLISLHSGSRYVTQFLRSPIGQSYSASGSTKAASALSSTNTAQSTAERLALKGTGLRAQSEALKPSKSLDLAVLHRKTSMNIDGKSQGVHLPPNSWRALKETHEEIHIPAPTPRPMGDDEREIPISELPSWAQPAFKGMSRLNRVQSKLCKSALFSPENMLLCAPTGAGKTNVAVLSILHELGMHLQGEESGGRVAVDAAAFKVVYIAPMKALVQEVVSNLSSRLTDAYGLNVRELTGDQSLTKAEIDDASIIVTTPEKWDIVTRKSGERTFTELVRLVIIDEIHLLADERGAVLESIVARTLRTVERTRNQVRLLGLSATLPNPQDVAFFLRVSPECLFLFDASYRPAPLQLQLLGITEKRVSRKIQLLNSLCYEKIMEQAGRNQVLVFVQGRKETARCAEALRSLCEANDTLARLLPEASASREILTQEAEASISDASLRQLLPFGFGIHHAGLERADRTLVEELFADGHIQVLVSTSTLAWGVNLPAHCVILRGTQIYSPERGGWTELSPLDVVQMLGRAGRPQFDSFGEGVIITEGDKLGHYLGVTRMALTVESRLLGRLADALNAEVALGAVSNVAEAVHWLGYTYLFVRMLKSPETYGLSADEPRKDALLLQRRVDLVFAAFQQLDRANLLKFDRSKGSVVPTALGRIAAAYYVSPGSMAVFNAHLRPELSEIELLRLFSLAEEFSNISVRAEEKLELRKLLERVPIPIKEASDDPSAKVNLLLQAYISGLRLEGLALNADMVYVRQSATRLLRALADIALKRGWAQLFRRLHELAVMAERRQWRSATPLRQIPEAARGGVTVALLENLERRDIPQELLYQLTPNDLADLVHAPKQGRTLHRLVHALPRMELGARVTPVTRSFVRLAISLEADFVYDARVHARTEPCTVTVEDSDGERVLHSQLFLLKASFFNEKHMLTATFQLPDPIPPQLFVRCRFDRWLGAETLLPVPLRALLLPARFPAPTSAPDISLPLSATGLPPSLLQRTLLASGMRALNRLQSVAVNAVTGAGRAPQERGNVLFCAPAGSGRSTLADIAILQAFHEYFTSFSTLSSNEGDDEEEGGRPKIVYVLPRAAEVSSRLCELGRLMAAAFPHFSEDILDSDAASVAVARLSGDASIDSRVLDAADIVLCTPGQWDALSRRWRRKRAVQNVSLFVFEGVECLGSGVNAADSANVGVMMAGDPLSAALEGLPAAPEPVAVAYEAVIARTRLMLMQLQSAEENVERAPSRMLCLGLPIANYTDVAQWLGCKSSNTFNFTAAGRPVPLELVVTPVDGLSHAQRVLSMAKHIYAACTEVINLDNSPFETVETEARPEGQFLARNRFGFNVDELDALRRVHLRGSTTLVLVHSRKQAQLTAIDLITAAEAENRPDIFQGASAEFLEEFFASRGFVPGGLARETLPRGVAVFHEGLSVLERSVISDLFGSGAISVVVAPLSAVWSLSARPLALPVAATVAQNAVSDLLVSSDLSRSFVTEEGKEIVGSSGIGGFQCSQVIVAGTETFDGQSHMYVDVPIHAVAAALGRASVPLKSQSLLSTSSDLKSKLNGVKDEVERVARACLAGAARAVVLTASEKREYLAKFLSEPTPIESKLAPAASEFLNAEIAAGTVESRQDALDLLTWSFLYRRVQTNPNAYGLVGSGPAFVADYLSDLVDRAVNELEGSQCVVLTPAEPELGQEESIGPGNLGLVGSFYNICPQTLEIFAASVTEKTKLKGLFAVLVHAAEFRSLPVSPHDSSTLFALAKRLPLPITSASGSNSAESAEIAEGGLFSQPSTKASVLLQSHLFRRSLPVDMRAQAAAAVATATRATQALVDVISSEGWLKPSLAAMELQQALVQAVWSDSESPLLQLPHFSMEIVQRLNESAEKMGIDVPEGVFDLLQMEAGQRQTLLQELLAPHQIDDVARFLNAFPSINVDFNFPDVSVAEDEEGEKSLSAVAGDSIKTVVTLARDSAQEGSSTVHAPLYPLQKQEQWWVVIGCRKANLLGAIKRVNLNMSLRVGLDFSVPSEPGQYVYTVYVISDSYVGVDQEYDFTVVVE